MTAPAPEYLDCIRQRNRFRMGGLVDRGAISRRVASWVSRESAATVIVKSQWALP